MDQVGEFLTQFATKEVFTVLAALATAWIGYKTACKTGGMIKRFATGASWGGLTAAGLLFAGFAGVGLGLGENFARIHEDNSPQPPAIQGMDDSDLRSLLDTADDNDKDGEKIKEILAYAQQRDEQNRRTELAWKIQTLPEEQWGAALKEYNVIPTSFTKPDDHFKPLSDAIEIKPVPEAINEESMMSVPMATLSFFLGVASIIASCFVFANRKKKPSHIV